MKYFSMFTGIGGFELGIQKAHYFDIARKLAEQSTSARKTAAVVVRDDVILSMGSNTHTEPCKREGFPTGVGYDLCDGCNYDNHAEANALRGIDAEGADLYLFGHYYLCDPCQDKVDKAGIKNVFIKNALIQETVPAYAFDIDRLECVGYSEIDKYAIQTYEKNFKGHKNYGSATTIDSGDLPDFDLLVGGFPCQAFSVAGKRGGFNDTRGTLFFDVARILKDKKPRHLVLENVKGLLSHDGGRTFETIIGVLTDLGYDVEWCLLNSKNFGVPQNRERVYIVGHLRADSGRKVFPLRSHDEPTDGLPRQQAYSTTITTRYNATGNGTYIAERELNAQGKVKQIGQIYPNKHNSQAGRIYDKEGISPTLDVAAGGNRQPKVIVPMRWIRTEEGKEIRREARKSGKDYTPFNGAARTLAPSDSGIIGTITSQAVSKDSLLGDGMRIRRLTPKECERLQGFPDDWTLGVSDSQRYKQCGNAVTTNAVQAVVAGLIESGHLAIDK